MSDHYLASKIKEALANSGGDKHAAQKLLITWAVRDQTLLLGLTKPHLKGIIAAHIDHAARPPAKGDGAKTTHFSKAELDKMVTARPLGEKRSPVVPPPKTSARQADVMHRLAEAFRKKKT